MKWAAPASWPISLAYIVHIYRFAYFASDMEMTCDRDHFACRNPTCACAPTRRHNAFPARNTMESLTVDCGQCIYRSPTSSCTSSLSSARGRRRSCRSRARHLDSSSITSSSYHYWVSVVFYGLERLAKSSRQQTKALSSEDQTSARVFWIHITSFTVYTGLVGCLLLHLETHTSKGCFLLRCDGLTFRRQRFWP
jgi:hypothetical protein